MVAVSNESQKICWIVLLNALEVSWKALEYISQLHDVYFCLLKWTTKLYFLIMVTSFHLMTTYLVGMEILPALWIWPARTAQIQNRNFPMFSPQRMQTYESGHTELRLVNIQGKSFIFAFYLIMLPIISSFLPLEKCIKPCM